MEIRPYKLYGKSELLLLEEAILKKVEHWFIEWSGSEIGLQSIEIITDPMVNSVPDNFYCVSYNIDYSSVVLFIEEDLYLNFPDILLPLNSKISGEHSSMVKKIMNEVFFDLIKSFIKITGSKNIELKPLSNENILDFDISGHKGDIIVKIAFKQGLVFLRLPYLIVDKLNRYVPDVVMNKAKLLERNNCLITGNITLTVNVGDAQVDFGSVVDMQEGDVIRLDSKITDKMEVTTRDGDFICGAYLGKQNTNKAIKVII